MPRYFVSYAVFDSKHQRSNVLFHSGLIFYEADDQLKKIQAKSAWGLYSHQAVMPKTRNPLKQLWHRARKFFGFTFRITGSYAVIKEENAAELTKGKGLTGETYEITQGQYQELLTSIEKDKTACIKAFEEHKITDPLDKKQISRAEQAYKASLQSIAKKLLEESKSSTSIKTITKKEAMRKAIQTCKIKPFNFSLFRSTSSVCKSDALKRLEKVLVKNNLNGHTKPFFEKRINRLKGPSPLCSVPRYKADKLDPIVLSGNGDIEVRGKRTRYAHLPWNEKTDLWAHGFNFYNLKCEKQTVAPSGEHCPVTLASQ